MENDKSPGMPITEALKELIPVLYWAVAVYLIFFHPGSFLSLGLPVVLVILLFYVLFLPVSVTLLILACALLRGFFF